jgi:O-antigen ligase
MTVARAQLGVTGFAVPGFLRWAEVIVVAGIVLAVLAFGGTEPASFAVVEILFAGVAIVFLARPWRTSVAFPKGMLAIPALLAGWILVQLCPWPASWARSVSAGDAGEAQQRFRTLTIEPYATRVHFLVVLTCIIGFFLTYIISQNEGARRRLVMVFALLGLGEALYGLVQYLTGWQKIFGYAKRYDLQEATGTYINRNHYAGFLEMVLPLAFALAFYEVWKLRKNKNHRLSGVKRLAARPGMHNAVFWLAVTVVLFCGLVYSRSRMGIIAASVTTVLLLALAWSACSFGRAGLYVCGAFLVLSASLAAWMGAESVMDRFQSTAQEYPYSNHNRLSIWRDTLRLIGRHPLMGTGLGTFPIAYTAVQTTFLGEFVNHAHNDCLEMASDMGIPAASVLVVAFVWLLVRSVKRFRSAAKKHFDRIVALGCAGSIAAILLHSLADFNLYIPANALVFASILGLSMSVPAGSSNRSA